MSRTHDIAKTAADFEERGYSPEQAEEMAACEQETLGDVLDEIAATPVQKHLNCRFCKWNCRIAHLLRRLADFVEGRTE
jgi:hypothetical protein